MFSLGRTIAVVGTSGCSSRTKDVINSKYVGSYVPENSFVSDREKGEYFVGEKPIIVSSQCPSRFVPAPPRENLSRCPEPLHA